MTDDHDGLAHLRTLIAGMIWMSGASDFGPDGVAGKHWESTVRPSLFAAMKYVDDQDASENTVSRTDGYPSVTEEP